MTQKIIATKYSVVFQVFHKYSPFVFIKIFKFFYLLCKILLSAKLKMYLAKINNNVYFNRLAKIAQ